MKKGLIHVYTGAGKGKTTAAMGLALRAAGCGYQVKIFQFCKGRPSGELNMLQKLDRIELHRDECGSTKFSWDMNAEEKAEWIDAQQMLFDDACEAACDPDCDLVILDEALGAVHAGALQLSQLLYLMSHKYKGTELVITGRDAPEQLIQAADYVTEMRAVRHPYEQGIDARRGIEF
ncbi:cob(I)yrinic acid a,c-diamide adenosyltransferase [Eubacteriales bacterium OttesenSCG-928-N13]|nr:cob(I)yrinic acid a,c-diamide adenosyltransferase [Eubacteriales bacterium OttesenSCG-928-N13]